MSPSQRVERDDAKLALEPGTADGSTRPGNRRPTSARTLTERHGQSARAHGEDGAGVDNPYTRSRDVVAIARIEADLEHIVDVVTKADPQLRSLVLTGGFARGEGAMRDGRPQNDYDLVAIRGVGKPLRAYDEVREQLEQELGLHIDLAPVYEGRLRWLEPSLFWYETRACGRVIWGQDLLDQIPVKEHHQVRPSEAFRLLSNRAAGLVLVGPDGEPEAVRIQACKALLAAMDVHLWSHGLFAPTQTGRWETYDALVRQDPEGATQADLGPSIGTDAIGDPLALRAMGPRTALQLAPWRPAFGWAYEQKTLPASAPARDAHEVWHEAAQAVMEALPIAAGVAGVGVVADLVEVDELVQRAVYWRNVVRAPERLRFVLDPASRVRAWTWQLLAAVMARGAEGYGRTPRHAVAAMMGPDLVGRSTQEILDALRDATCQ